jgi:uncharacterized protein (DUF2147 family)
MKKIYVIVTSLLILSSAVAQKAVPGHIVGVWISEDKNLKIEIYKAGPQYFARQIGETFLFESDGRTPKRDLNDSLEGLRKINPNNVIFIRNLDYDRGIYVGGLLYDYKTGNTYNSLIKLNGENILKLRVYATASLFGRTTTWTRVQ